MLTNKNVGIELNGLLRQYSVTRQQGHEKDLWHKHNIYSHYVTILQTDGVHQNLQKWIFGDPGEV